MLTVSVVRTSVSTVLQNYPPLCTHINYYSFYHVSVVEVTLSVTIVNLYCYQRPSLLHVYKSLASTLWIKPTEALNSNFIGITTLHVLGSLSAHHQEFLAVHRLWYILCSCDPLLPGLGWILLLVENGSSQLHKMYQSRRMAKSSWWWAERLPETCRVVIPIKLEFSASVGFIHKISVTMHGHTIIKFSCI